MGEYFLIANDKKRQFLDPFELPASDKFPSIMTSPFISNAVLWLTCDANHAKWKKLQSGPYTSKYAGSWSGDKYLLYGDYENEEESRELRATYDNISIEVAAMMFEIPTGLICYLDDFENGDDLHKRLFSKVALLENPPSSVVSVFSKLYGKDWKGFASRGAYD